MGASAKDSSLATLAALRAAAQHLTSRRHRTPRALVEWLGAVQAQDLGAARWALGIRLGGDVTDAAINEAISSGELLRTHALRGTWQLVTPADVRWVSELVAPREIARAMRRYEQLGLDAKTFRRANERIVRALEERPALTREELADELERAGISPEGQRLPHLLQRAELDGLVCSGPMRGKKTTWALLERRAPEAKRLDRAAALEEVARRYFHSRGPATVGDFTWWSGLSAAEARAGLEAVRRELRSEHVGGQTYWDADADADAKPPAAMLLPAFDEYLIGYRDRSAVLDPAVVKRVNDGGGLLAPVIVVEGRVVGTWRREITRSVVRLELELFEAVRPAGRRAIRSAAEAYGAFLDRDVALAPPG